MTDPTKYDLAFENLMALEGGKAHDTGGWTNYGITLRNLIASHDMDFDKNHDGILDKSDLWAMTKADAKLYVYKHWYQPAGLDEILSPCIAVKALDIIYNMGEPRGVKIIQKALARLGHQIRIDGKMGPKTLHAINSTNDASLLESMRACQRGWYEFLINNNPALYGEYKNGWLRRAAT